jgi:hypothetical protein
MTLLTSNNGNGGQMHLTVIGGLRLESVDVVPHLSSPLQAGTAIGLTVQGGGGGSRR